MTAHSVLDALEIKINPVKTYKTADNARAAILKTGDERIPHLIIQHTDGRYYPLFMVNDTEMSLYGIHFRWNCYRR
jgi:hypothetical protein